MPGTIFAALLNVLDKRTVRDVAHALGQPQQSVWRAMESSIAALLCGVAGKSEDLSALRKIFDTVSSPAGDVSWSQVAASVADPNSSLMEKGKRILMTFFGSAGQAVTPGISRDSGLSSGAISTLLTMTAPVVMTVLNKRVRDGEMTISSLGGFLQRERPTIQSALPVGLSEMFWPGAETVGTVSPVVAQVVKQERSFRWLAAPPIAALVLGLLYLLMHA